MEREANETLINKKFLRKNRVPPINCLCYRNTVCNRIKGSTEGELFPMYIDKHAVFRIYRKSLCRPIPIVFKEEVMLESGINGYLYTMPDNLLDPPDQNPDNACYCKNKDKCLKRGLSDLTPCYYSTYH